MYQILNFFQTIAMSALFYYYNRWDASEIIRETSNGLVEGTMQTSELGQKYYAFRGVPFAESPITGIDPHTGQQVDRRFKPPEPLKRRWIIPLKVHNFGKKCAQSQRNKANEPGFDEDCLFLNIFVPADGAKQKTVIVYIHGGGFNIGDSTDYMYGPDFLLSQDNIFITIQYRLGIFGFLNLNYGEYTGNMGLKDQQLALAWIYENIEYFSGKRDEILLYGQSGGGASVHFHTLNVQSRKYFNRVYISSSSAFNAYAIRRTDHVQLVQNCTQSNDINQMIEYLKTAEMAKILYGCFPIERIMGRVLYTWVPTIEMPNAPGAFLTKTPNEIYNSTEAPVIDAMFDFMAEEIIYFRPDLIEITEPLLRNDWQDISVELPFEGFTKQAYPKEYAQAMELLRAAYYPAAAANVNETQRRNIALLSDATFADGILKAVIRQTNANHRGCDENQHKNTFLFRFAVHSELNKYFPDNKVCHADDLAYILHSKARNYEKHLQSKDTIYEFIMRSVKMITNFACTGNPSVEGATPFKLCKPPDEILCQEITNSPWTNVTTNIKEQLHYDTWREIEQIYENLKIFSG